MIRLTKQTDYALVLMTLMASAGQGAVHAARDLATRSHLPQPMVSKILKALVREGLLVSHRGAAGGYGLAGDPRRTTAADVIRAMEGPIAITDCSTDSGASCSLAHSCPTCGTLQRVNRAVNEALEAVTLLDMARPSIAAPAKAAELQAAASSF